MIFEHHPTPRNQHLQKCIENLIEIFINNYYNKFNINKLKLYSYISDYVFIKNVIFNITDYNITTKIEYQYKGKYKFITIISNPSKSKVFIETNLKKKYCLKELSYIIKNQDHFFNRIEATINNHIYKKI